MFSGFTPKVNAMIQQRLLSVAFFLTIFSGFVSNEPLTAGDYIWARSGWGNGNWGRNYGGMSNGYGGYYVPRNSYGNNYETRSPFRNPNGYIVPAQSGVYQTAQPAYVPVVPAQPTVVLQSTVVPQASSVPTTIQVPSTTSAPAPVK